VEVPLISVDVAVTDVDGSVLSTLAKEDFLIYEDGTLQQIQQFSPVNVPYNVLFLFDCSGSTRPRQSLMAAAIDRFINKLRPQDTFAIAEFGVGVDLRSSWRERGEAGSTKALLGTSADCSGTDFYGALEWSAGRMQNIQGRKGVLVYTDGQTDMHMRPMLVGGQQVLRASDSIDDAGFQRVLRAIQASRTPFHFVAIDTDINPRSDTPVGAIYNLQQTRSRMEQLAEVSGGRIVFPKREEDVIALYEHIGHELGTSYNLQYVSSNAPGVVGFRRIVVQVRSTDARVRQSRE